MWRFPPSETFKPDAWSWICCARAGPDVQTGTWEHIVSFLLQQLELDPSLLESLYVVFSPRDGSGGLTSPLKPFLLLSCRKASGKGPGEAPSPLCHGFVRAAPSPRSRYCQPARAGGRLFWGWTPQPGAPGGILHVPIGASGGHENTKGCCVVQFGGIVLFCALHPPYGTPSDRVSPRR